MKPFVVFVNCLIIATSCVNKIDSNYVNPYQNDNIDWLFESYSITPLETTDDCLISEISKIKLYNDKYYILDGKKAILVFDKNGMFLGKVSHVGRGHGEYIEISSFDVNTRNGNVSVYDVSSSKMLVYSSNDEFLYSFKIEEDVPRDFALLDNGDYLFLTYDYMKGARRGIWQCDSLGAFKKQLVEIDANFKYASGIIPSYFRHIGNKVYVKGPEDNNYLYHISSDTIVASYKVHTGIKIPKRIRRNPLPTTNEENKGKVYSIVNYCETDSWVLLSVYDMIDNPTMLYNKRTNASYYILSNDDEVIDDMPFVGTVITTTSEAFINIISVDMILSHQLLMEQFPTIDSNSNPVIAICRLTK